jgi:hypothetical protein
MPIKWLQVGLVNWAGGVAMYNRRMTSEQMPGLQEILVALSSCVQMI